MRFGNAVSYLRENPAHSARKNPPAAAFILIPRGNLRAGKLRPPPRPARRETARGSTPNFRQKTAGAVCYGGKISADFPNAFRFRSEKFCIRNRIPKFPQQTRAKSKRLRTTETRSLPEIGTEPRALRPPQAQRRRRPAHAQTAGGVSPAARQTSKPAAGRFCPLRGSPPPRPFRRRVSAFRKPHS